MHGYRSLSKTRCYIALALSSSPLRCSWRRYQTGMTQSRIVSRLRIKCFSLESWVDFNKKKTQDILAISRYESMSGNPLESWVDSESISGKPFESWVESTEVSETLLESWADSNEFVGKTLETKAQKWSYKVNSWVESSKRSYQVDSNTEWPKKS